MRIRIGAIHTRKDRPAYWTAAYYAGRKRHRRSYRKLDCRTKAEVRRCLLEDLKAETNAQPKPAPAALLAGLLEEFFTVNRHALREDTQRSYRVHTVRLAKAYGDLPMRDLTLGDLEVWVATYESTGVSPSTVNQAIRTLRRLWSWGEARGDVPRNIAKGLRFRRVVERTALSLSEAEIPRFLDSCTTAFRPVAEMALFAGLRLGEVINLKWSAVDLEQGHCEVRSEAAFTTKSGRNRVIPLHPQLRQTHGILDRKSEYVFCAEDGTQRAPKSSWFRMSVQAAATRAGIERRLNFHSLRHTFATRLVMYSADMEAARRILGHADVQTTRIYVHPTEQLVRAMGKIPTIIA